jgi:hypothetical protein
MKKKCVFFLSGSMFTHLPLIMMARLAPIRQLSGLFSRFQIRPFTLL